MKKTLIVIAVIFSGIYFGCKALWKLGWRLGLVGCLVSPVFMACYLAYGINVRGWKIETLWVMPPLILISVLVAQREFSWTEPLLDKKTR